MKMKEQTFEKLEKHMLSTDDKITVYPYQRQRELIDRAHKEEVNRRLELGLAPISRSKWIISVLMERVGTSVNRIQKNTRREL